MRGETISALQSRASVVANRNNDLVKISREVSTPEAAVNDLSAMAVYSVDQIPWVLKSLQKITSLPKEGITINVTTRVPNMVSKIRERLNLSMKQGDINPEVVRCIQYGYIVDNVVAAALAKPTEPEAAEPATVQRTIEASDIVADELPAMPTVPLTVKTSTEELKPESIQVTAAKGDAEAPDDDV
jgi:hypothetical protein